MLGYPDPRGEQPARLLPGVPGHCRGSSLSFLPRRKGLNQPYLAWGLWRHGAAGLSCADPGQESFLPTRPDAGGLEPFYLPKLHGQRGAEAAAACAGSGGWSQLPRGRLGLG